jgi:hypothetical protein
MKKSKFGRIDSRPVLTSVCLFFCFKLMEMLQRYEGGEEEMTAIGDRYGYWVVHPESRGYDFLAGNVFGKVFK